MANLLAKFQAIDEMSDKLEKIANAGAAAADAWDSAALSANATFEKAIYGADETASAIENTNVTLNDFADAAADSANATDKVVDSLEDEAKAADQAADFVENLGNESRNTGKESEAMGKTTTSALNDLSNAIVSLGIAQSLKMIADMFFMCSEGAAELETASAKVSTVADMSVKTIGMLSGEVLNLSRDTGDAAIGLSEAVYQAISASVDTADAVAFVADANKLAVGGFTQNATAVDVLTTALNAYNLESEQSTQISDILIMTQNLGKTTVDELSSSVGTVIPLASAYNVEMANLSTSYAVLTANGIATAESGTYIKSMLNELGTSSSDVAKVLQDETGMSFALLMEQGYSLGDVMDVLGNSVDGDTTKFGELWSSTEAGVGALSLLNAGSERYNEVLGKMENSAGATEKAYKTMTSTTQEFREDMETAIKNLSIVIGDDLNPALGEMYDLSTDAFNWMGEFVEENPAVTAGLGGLSTAFVVGGGAVTAFAVAQSFMTAETIANTAAVAAWNAVLAINPVVLATTGVVALTAGLVTFASVLSSQEDEYESWTASTRAQYDELEKLNDEYDTACDRYGETSEEALRLRYEVDDLTASFEENKQFLEDFVLECEALVESNESLIASYKSSTAEIDNQEVSTLSLIQKLEDLAISTDDSATAQWQMEAIIAQLNEELPGLALSYDDVTSSVDGTIEAFKRAAEAQSEDNYRKATQEAYVALMDEQRVLEEQLTEAKANLEAERNRMIADGIVVEDSVYGRLAYDADEYSDAVDMLTDALNENEQEGAKIVARYNDIVHATEEAKNVQITYEDAVDSAISSVSGSLEGLAERYDTAYEAARTSIDGTIGLFQTMATETELSTDDMLDSFQSQLEYLNLYNENLEKASQYNLDEELISSLSDGSEESAGYLNAIIEKIDELGGSTQAASDFVEKMNTSFLEVEEGKDRFSNTLAEMEEGFAEALDAMEAKLLKAVDNMNMDSKSAQAAKETMTAYIDSIREQQANAESAAAAVANAVNIALASGFDVETGVMTSGFKHYATGTDYAAPGLAVVGEEGPELVYFAGGETVLPADETSNILLARGSENLRIAPPTVDVPTPNDSGEKKFTININGSGDIGVDRTMSEESVLPCFNLLNIIIY